MTRRKKPLVSFAALIKKRAGRRSAQSCEQPLLTENKRINGEDFEAVTRALPLRAEEPVSSLDINKPD